MSSRRLNPSLLSEIKSLPRFAANKRLNYSKVSYADFAKVMTFLKNHINDAQAGLKQAAQHIGISPNTLTGWRNQLKTNPNYNPKDEYDLLHHSMSPKLEEKIVNEIVTEFLNPGFYFNNHILKLVATAAFNSAPPEEKYRKTFLASDTWCISFRKRHGFVWRRAHYKRRPYHSEKSERYKAQFQEEIQSIYTELKNVGMEFLLCNCDETSWKIAYVGELTWARKGSKEVKINIDYNDKDCFTTMAAITASNDKLPLFLIAKGDTERCHKQFRNILEMDPESAISHSHKGWMTAEVMKEYLSWIRQFYDKTYAEHENYVPGQTEIHLILDCHTSHRQKKIKNFAKSLHIRLHYIPAGYTDELQPLDIRIFGALKAKARSAFFNLIYQDKNLKPDKGLAAKILVSCWKSLREELIESSWSLYVRAVTEEEEQNSVVEGYNDPDTSDEFHHQISHEIKQMRNPSSQLSSDDMEYEEEEEFLENDYDNDDDEADNNESDECSGELNSTSDDALPAETDWESESDEFFEEIKQNLQLTPDDFKNEDSETEEESGCEEETDENSIQAPNSIPPQETFPYQENIPIPESSTFMAREIELKRQRARDSRTNILEIQDAYGMTNIGKSCYYNCFLQFLLILPKIEDYILPADAIDIDQADVYCLTEEVYEKLISTNETIDLDKIIDNDLNENKLPPEIRDKISKKEGAEPRTFINDFIIPDAISVVQNGKVTPMMQIDINLRSFKENLDTIDIQSIKNVLICVREHYINKVPFIFPLSFEVGDIKMGLKFVITHPTFHYISYIRSGTSKTFIEVNDHRVRKAFYY